MTKGYVFQAGAPKALTKMSDGSNLPPPKVGKWQQVKAIDDVYRPGLIGFDADAFEKQGYQIWPNKGGVLSDQDLLSSKDILSE